MKRLSNRRVFRLLPSKIPNANRRGLPPLKKGVVDRNAIGGGICFAATPQIPRPRFARPAPFCKGGYSKSDSGRGPQINLRSLPQRPARPLHKAAQRRLPPSQKTGVDCRLPPFQKRFTDFRLPPLKKGVVDRTAIGGGICSAATPQIPRPRYARPAPFSKGGKHQPDSLRIATLRTNQFSIEPSP